MIGRGRGRGAGVDGRRFAYYERLSRAQQRVYRRSDALREVPLPRPAAARALVPALEAALAADSRNDVAVATTTLVAAVLRDLGAPPVRVKVLLKRPRERRGGELHGLYVAGNGEPPVLTVWMRTAARKQPVKLRTFLRTVMHEVVHHLDFQLLGLAPSFHCEGFFAREAHLARQLLDAPLASRPGLRRTAPLQPAGAAAPTPRPQPRGAPGKARQLTLFN